jgi:hypothetical protein
MFNIHFCIQGSKYDKWFEEEKELEKQNSLPNS